MSWTQTSGSHPGGSPPPHSHPSANLTAGPPLAPVDTWHVGPTAPPAPQLPPHPRIRIRTRPQTLPLPTPRQALERTGDEKVQHPTPPHTPSTTRGVYGSLQISGLKASCWRRPPPFISLPCSYLPSSSLPRLLLSSSLPLCFSPLLLRNPSPPVLCRAPPTVLSFPPRCFQLWWSKLHDECGRARRVTNPSVTATKYATIRTSELLDA